MTGDIEKMLSGAMNSPEGARLLSRKGELESIMGSSEAMRRTVEASAADMSRAAAAGDAAAMQAALKKLTASAEGAQLIEQIRRMMQG